MILASRTYFKKIIQKRRLDLLVGFIAFVLSFLSMLYWNIYIIIVNSVFFVCLSIFLFQKRKIIKEKQDVGHYSLLLTPFNRCEYFFNELIRFWWLLNTTFWISTIVFVIRTEKFDLRASLTLFLFLCWFPCIPTLTQVSRRKKDSIFLLFYYALLATILFVHAFAYLVIFAELPNQLQINIFLGVFYTSGLLMFLTKILNRQLYQINRRIQLKELLQDFVLWGVLIVLPFILFRSESTIQNCLVR